MIVPYAYKSYADYNPASGRWDQAFLDRILHGEDHRPPSGVIFQSSDHDFVIRHGGVLILPVGSYRDHDELVPTIRKVWDDLASMPWGVVFATSDEDSTFPWHKLDPWPENVRLWVMTPRPGQAYPPGTRFMGEGAPTGAASADRALTRDLDLFLVGQGGHERRDQAFEATWSLGGGQRMRVDQTPGFAQGMDRESYLFHMSRAWVLPAPSGPCTQDSFRAYEALETGGIPILDGLRPGNQGAGYWEMIGMGDVAPVIDDWSMLPGVVDEILADRCWWAAKTSSRWQRYKRDLIGRMHADVAELVEVEPRRPVDDEITVIVLTSPIPSHPDTGIIDATLASITERLPVSEILIGCDGVRPEQQDRTDDYHRYLWELCESTLDRPQITPFVFTEHLHQSGMMRALLDEVRTPYVLFVEHDTPLEGEIPFGEIMETMQVENLNLMRFTHEAGIVDGHEHLFLDLEPRERHYVRTVQFSARPHLARTNWYRDVVHRYFGAESRTFVEDVAHGAAQHGIAIQVAPSGAASVEPKQVQAAWRKWRMAVYAPEGTWKRSGHLDGRATDPKYPMFVSYDGERPAGGPAEGWM